VEDNLMDEGQEPRSIESAGFFDTVYFPLDFLVQDIFVYGHEIALDIQFEDIAISRVIAGARTDKMIQPLDAIRSSLAETAAITVVQKRPFKNRIDVVVNQMMDDSILKISGKNLPLQRFEADKTDALPDGIGSCRDFPAKLEKVFLIIHFKGYRAPRPALIAAGRIISFEQIE
jgi:hypothetical protein